MAYLIKKLINCFNEKNLLKHFCHELETDFVKIIYIKLYSTYFIYDYMMLYEKRNTQPPFYGLIFLISNNGSFSYTIPQTEWYTPQLIRPVMEHWLKWKITQSRSIKRNQPDDHQCLVWECLQLYYLATDIKPTMKPTATINTTKTFCLIILYSFL